MPPVPATEGSEENNTKIDKVIKDHKEEKEKLNEERLKEKKKNNLMIYNIPEGEFEDSMERMIDDFNKLKKTYEDKGIALTEKDLLQINRIGVKKDDHIRPIVVTIAKPEKRMELLTKNQNLKLKHDHEVLNIYVSIDKTPKQREADKKLRDQLTLRRDGGDENIGIRNNKIVTLPFPGGA